MEGALVVLAKCETSSSRFDNPVSDIQNIPKRQAYNSPVWCMV